MNYILFSDNARNQMLPFTFTRPLADIRLGIFTIRQRWEMYLGSKTSTLTQDYLSRRFPLVKGIDNTLINASILPDAKLIAAIQALLPNQTLVQNELLIAYRVGENDMEGDHVGSDGFENIEPVEYAETLSRVSHLMDIVNLINNSINHDYALITKGRTSMPIPEHVRVIAPENVFVEEGAKLEMAMINASEGPVYLGKKSHVMDGAILRGPLVLCDNSTIKLGAKIYGNTVIGPHCKVGGEVSDSLFFGYSNKGHDGFLGHSVIGEWCNIGADTNTSNLKNNYSAVRLWSYVENGFTNTRQTFCGTFMGDYAKCGINTMFNTGTVVGVGAQIFGAGYMKNYIPSFTFGGPSGYSTVDIEKVLATERLTHARRGLELSAEEEEILRSLYHQDQNG
ncbi:MAG TPA: glucose-1-phosphate thymidylyltransferase [Bacteroidales bacterium]|nr:glucose-1-phosphate thymidylyltransferase [Bacteroidales bacterium]